MVTNFLFFLGKPFVWGPIGGGEAPPETFIRDFTLPARIIERLRKTILMTLRFNPFFYYTCCKASCIVIKTKETLKYIPASFKTKCVELIDVGVHHDEIAPVKPSQKGFRVLMVGSFDAWRGV
jgi:hypothetical protein